MFRFLNHYFPIPMLVLGLAEFALLTVVLHIVTQLLGWFDSGDPTLPIWLSAAVTLVILTTMMAVGLYNSDAFLDYRIGMVRALVTLLILVPVTITTVFVLNTTSVVAGRPGLPWHLAAIAAWLGCLAVTRPIFAHMFNLEIFRRRVLVLGTGVRALRLKTLALGRGPRYFIPVAYINACGDPRLVETTELPPDQECDRSVLARKARELGAEEIVLATDDRRGLPVHQLLECKLSGIRVTDYVAFCERETSSVDLEALQPSWFTLSDGFRTGPVAQLVKRSFDLTIGLMFLLLVLPLMLVTALAIKLESVGPVFYGQTRIGLREREFLLLKFRSMRVDAEGSGSPEWAKRHDPRATRVGAVIRKIRIDELPQLLNVLRGDMSLVGPRPERPYFVNQLAAVLPFYRERHTIRPGITGWAQVNYPYGASVEDARQKLAYDLYYLKHRSTFLDFVILIQTARVILFPAGAR